MSIPTAPTDLAVQSKTTSSIKLGWKDNANNEDGFQIWMKKDTGGFTLKAEVGAMTGTGGTKTYNVLGLTAGTHTFRVRAFNASKTQFSPYSNEVVETIP